MDALFSDHPVDPTLYVDWAKPDMLADPKPRWTDAAVPPAVDRGGGHIEVLR
jgi:hypothetical protein